MLAYKFEVRLVSSCDTMAMGQRSRCLEDVPQEAWPGLSLGNPLKQPSGNESRDGRSGFIEWQHT
ncbi:MAG: hypothetical protein AABO41_08505 [Acidobacteriota bacterium]